MCMGSFLKRQNEPYNQEYEDIANILKCTPQMYPMNGTDASLETHELY